MSELEELKVGPYVLPKEMQERFRPWILEPSKRLTVLQTQLRLFQTAMQERPLWHKGEILAVLDGTYMEALYDVTAKYDSGGSSG